MDFHYRPVGGFHFFMIYHAAGPHHLGAFARSRPGRAVTSPVSTVPFLTQYNISRYQLDNGLTILVARDTAAPVVAYQTFLRVGSADEEPGRTGLAHLFEHLIYKETSNVPEGLFSRLLEETGARDFNAWTFFDETVFTQVVPKTYLPLVIRLEADRMAHLILNEKQLEAEREVVLNERLYRCEDDPFGRIGEALYSLAFEVHPYRWPIIGWKQDIESISLSDCLEFYRRFYSPNNAIVVISGDVEPSEVVEQVDRFYGSLPAVPVNRPQRANEPPQTEVRHQTLTLPMESEVLQIGIRAPSLSHQDRPALQALDTILFHGRCSRLERSLLDSELATDVGGLLLPTRDPGLYDITIHLRPGRRAQEAREVVERELARIRSEGVTAEELLRAKRKIRMGDLIELRDHGGRAGFIGICEIAAGGLEQGLRMMQAVDELTLECVQAAANLWFNPQAMSFIEARPEVRSDQVVDMSSTLEMEDESTQEEEALDELPTSLGIEEAIDRDETSLVREVRQVVSTEWWRKEPLETASGWKATESSLSGDGRLYIAENPTLPLVSFRLYLPGGLLLEPPSREGLASLSVGMLQRGTRRRSRREFERVLEDLGASLDFGVNVERIEVGGSMLAEDYSEVMKLLTEALTERFISGDELEMLRREMIADIANERTDDKHLAERFFHRGLYGEHPLGRPASGRASHLEALTGDEAGGYLDAAINANGLVAAFAGHVTPDSVQPSLETLSRGIAHEIRPLHLPMLEPPRGRRLLIVDKPDRTQCQVLLGHPAVDPSHPDWPLLTLANAAFGGPGTTSRLMLEVREKRGWSYGAYARLEACRGVSTFSIWVFPSQEVVVDCIALVIGLLEQLVLTGLTETELEYARRMLLNGTAFDRETAESQARDWLTRAWFNTPRAAFLSRIANASRQEVFEAVRRHYHPERLLVTVVGSADRILAPLIDLVGVTEPEIHSYNED